VVLGIVLIVIIIGAYFGYQYLAVPPLSGQKIKIGIIGPYTGFGAGWGAHYKEGGIYAVEKINENGGILGAEVEYVLGDTESDAAVAVTVAERLITLDNVDALVGEPFSSSVLALQEVSADHQIIFISPGGGSEQVEEKVVDDPDRYTYFWHTWPSIATYAPPMMDGLTDIFKNAGFNTSELTISCIYADTDQGRGEAPLFVDSLEAGGWEVLSEDYVASTEVDFYPLLTKIKGLDPLCIQTTLPAVSSAAALLKQMRELEVPAMFWIPGATGNDPDFVSGVGTDIAYTLNGELFLPFEESFKNEFEARFGHEPHYLGVLQYESVNMLAKAIERAGSLDPDKITEELAKTDFVGVGGRYKFTLNTHGLIIGADYLPAVHYQFIDSERVLVYPIETDTPKIQIP
jgi:branched-chain amino acid transport system substrate-binding protein